MKDQDRSTTVSIVFSTFNGERTLPLMLSALEQLKHPEGGVQIIAIDNNSTDRTRSILENHASLLPLTLLHQPKRGKNRALNLALPLVEGRLVIFTDDDVLPSPDWITEFLRCAQEHEEYDLFGGTIAPYWQHPPEPWVLDAVPHGVTFALTAPDLPSGEIFPGLIWGANMMVRRHVFDSGHRFNEDIGPSAGQYIMGSETEFNVRIGKHGHKSWFCPTAKVQHIIRDFQMEAEWLIRRAYRFGRNMCIQNYNEKGSLETSLFGTLAFPKWMLRRALSETLTGHILRLAGKKSGSIKRLWEAAFLRGYMAQARNIKHTHARITSREMLD